MSVLGEDVQPLDDASLASFRTAAENGQPILAIGYLVPVLENLVAAIEELRAETGLPDESPVEEPKTKAAPKKPSTRKKTTAAASDDDAK